MIQPAHASGPVRIALWAILVAGLWTGGLRAQSSAGGSVDSLHRPDRDAPADPVSPWLNTRHRISLWAGGSNNASRLLGRTPDAEFRMVALRYKRRLTPRRRHGADPAPFVLFYTADVVPWARLSVPGSAIPERGNRKGDGIPRPDLATTGVGAVPLGLQLNLRAHPRIQPFLSASTGVLYFVDSVPDQRGKPFNFTLDFGAGLQVTLGDRLHLAVGYRYHHLSNGYRGRINPGVDANLFYLGTALGL